MKNNQIAYPFRDREKRISKNSLGIHAPGK